MIRKRLKELPIEEVANALTHGFGLLLSIAGFICLISLAVIKGDSLHITSSIVYGVSLVTLYAASTLYHTAISPELKNKLRVLDHCCIYLLIAGSYTPFLLVVLPGAFGNGLLAFVWAFAFFGIALKIIFRGRFNALGIIFYVAMGWLGVIAAQPLYLALGLVPLILVLSGGIAYSLGLIFFGWHRIRHHHAIFHVFVLAGSVIHFFAIAVYVLR